MSWTWKKEYLDVILVPIGLLLMLGYHLFLLYRYLKIPHTTTLGHEYHCRASWVERMMQIDIKERGQALTVINTNISAATTLASICLVLSSLIGTWIENTTDNIFRSNLIYGNTSQSMMSIKHISLLSCFLVGFASFIQTTRHFVHVNFLLTMPNADVPISTVKKAMVNGSNFWSVGVRALYFAITLLLWIFGPIPMFVCSVLMVVMLHNLDSILTPLHQFQPNILQKIGEEMTAVSKVIQHHGRPHGN